MARLKPILAALATVAIALTILLVAHLLRDPVQPRDHPGENQSRDNTQRTAGLKYEIVTLDERSELEPEDIWPRHGQRMASPDFWVLWKTFEFSECRLLCTSDRKLWYDLGRIAGTANFLPVDITFFDGSVTFAVDFTHKGIKYRSRPRSVSFKANAASFASREYKFRVGVEGKIRLQGRDPVQVPADNFLMGWFPPGLVVYPQPKPGTAQGGDIVFGVQNIAEVPAGGCMGWLQVYDEVQGTYDRTLIRLSPGQ